MNQLIKEMAEQGMEGRVIGWVLDTTGVPPWRLYTQTDGQEVVVVGGDVLQALIKDNKMMSARNARNAIKCQKMQEMQENARNTTK